MAYFDLTSHHEHKLNIRSATSAADVKIEMQVQASLAQPILDWIIGVGSAAV